MLSPKSPKTIRPKRGRSLTQDFEMFKRMMPPIPREFPPRVPAPSHRHGAPSGPWPFLDLADGVDPEQLMDTSPLPSKVVCDHIDPETCNSCWTGYPQSLFPNWTPAQQKRSRISKIVDRSTETCIIRYVDIGENGRFTASKELSVTYAGKDAHWVLMKAPRPEGTRLRAMFLEHLSGPVLQMIGTKYKVEPFFFSSSVGWIPSRYQEDVQPQKGDHITITLTFIRTIQNPTTRPPSPSSSHTASTISRLARRPPDQVIDTQAPLSLRSSDHILVPDLLALHMVRSPGNSTIISYHTGEEHRTTTAASLHARLNGAGRSVYWNTIFAKHDDPTFVFLVLMWYALYSWDESFEVLYSHVCWLEARVIHTNDMDLTQELHVVQAHLLHYASLLEDFRKSVVFVRDTPNPALDDPTRYSQEERDRSIELISKECGNLLDEIHRLEKSRVMQGRRIKNVMKLGFSSVNIEDSKHMQRLTEAAVKDSAAMKQISYLTMFFLPATLSATIFGMNIDEINPNTNGSIPKYFATTIPLTVLTIWIIVAFQFRPDSAARAGSVEEQSMVWQTLGRIGWPVVLVSDFIKQRKSVMDGQGRGQGEREV